MSLKIKRGTNDQRLTVVPAEGELVYATDIKKLFIGDGTTTGGNIVGLSLGGTLENNMYLDTHHLYGSNGLDLNGNNGDITANNIFADFRGSVYGDDSTILIDATNSVVLGPIQVDINDIIIAGGLNGEVLSTDGNGNLSWITLSGGSGVSIPSQNGHAGEFLSTDGYGNLSWAPVAGNYGHYIGSVYADDSSILVDSATSTIHGTIDTSTIISSFTNNINFGNSNNDLRTVSFNFNIGSETQPFTIRNIAKDFATMSRFEFETYGTSIDNPTVLSAGQFLGSVRFNANGPNRPAAGFAAQIDPNGTYGSGYASGKFIIFTYSGPITPDDLNVLTFDKDGHLGINKESATEALDVAGNGKFSGFVQFGSLSTTERNALNAANGMVIYNSTDNRFQGYQNGGWINLDNGTSAA